MRLTGVVDPTRVVYNGTAAVLAAQTAKRAFRRLSNSGLEVSMSIEPDQPSLFSRFRVMLAEGSGHHPEHSSRTPSLTSNLLREYALLTQTYWRYTLPLLTFTVNTHTVSKSWSLPVNSLLGDSSHFPYQLCSFLR
jgi:hypothetical protein